MSRTNLAKKLADFNDYMAKAKAAGSHFLTYKLPCGCGDIETLAPRFKGHVWDSLATCPHCDSLYYVAISHDVVRVRTTPGGALCLA